MLNLSFVSGVTIFAWKVAMVLSLPGHTHYHIIICWLPIYMELTSFLNQGCNCKYSALCVEIAGDTVIYTKLHLINSAKTPNLLLLIIMSRLLSETLIIFQLYLTFNRIMDAANLYHRISLPGKKTLVSIEREPFFLGIPAITSLHGGLCYYHQATSLSIQMMGG